MVLDCQVLNCASHTLGWVLSLHSLLLKKKILFGGNDGFRFLLSGNFPHSFVAVFKLLLRGNSNFKVPNQHAHVNFIFVCVCVCVCIYIYIKNKFFDSN